MILLFKLSGDFADMFGPQRGRHLIPAPAAVQGAVQHDEAQLIELAKHATEQLRELFEADAARPLAGFPQGAGPETARPG